MPIYEYRCGSCGFQKEFLQKMSDPLLTTCPECKKDSFSKMLSAAGFQLKGSGWYATDFKNSGNSSAKPTATPNAGGESKPVGASDSGGDAKPETSAAHSCGTGTCGTCS